ncbi:hypothetical protein [Thermoplasma volcanium GSS1]|uniref:KaiC-like domain-containing protein n=1 Tax=Thermoplasma volcanium (strain ATCC 51530 / DSM 4299 / JCM 9571 / NBRC 15438 / GSS1) TaxID=273116 RepID=Q97CD2_THEVO|nr:RAD55 family ATPase [Thermoplasma volcanium]BAB59312.1 hypothetical protein [Thermoplasma volcanium GSS1]
MQAEGEKSDKISKISTGIPRVDELLYGGFDGRDNIVVSGNNFSQKRSFIYNFIKSSANSGMKVIIINVDGSSESLLADLARRGTDLENIILLDGFSKNFQEKVPPNAEVIDDPSNVSSVLKQYMLRAQKEKDFIFVFLSATPYLMDFNDQNRKFFVQLVHWNRKNSLLSTYVLDDFVGQTTAEWFAYMMDFSLYFKNDGDYDYMRVLSLKPVRTKDWIRIYKDSDVFTLGSFNVERIR